MNDLRTLPLSALELSATKAQAERRAHFNQAALAELAESIKTVGLLSPLVARPMPITDSCGELFEIVAVSAALAASPAPAAPHLHRRGLLRASVAWWRDLLDAGGACRSLL
jgi:hypothetical protein